MLDRKYSAEDYKSSKVSIGAIMNVKMLKFQKCYNSSLVTLKLKICVNIS